MQRSLDPIAAGVHECFEARFALFVTGCLVRGSVATEAKNLLVHDEINVLREALDEFPSLGKRGAALERDVPADVRVGEDFAQRPAYPEVLFHAGGVEAHRPVHLNKGVELVGGSELQKGIHGSGGRRFFGNAAEDVGDPGGRAGGIRGKGSAVGRGKVSAQLGNDIIVHTTFSDPAQSKDDLSAFRIFRGNKPRGNVAEDDFGFAAADATARAGGQVPAPHGHLVAESEHVGRVGTGREYVATGLALDEILHGIVAGT